jgi:hypothetical protein
MEPSGERRHRIQGYEVEEVKKAVLERLRKLTEAEEDLSALSDSLQGSL